MKIALISDTHGATPDVPEGDLLIHAGDLSMRGLITELEATLAWLESLPHEYKVIIPGNHDFFVEEAPETFKLWAHHCGIDCLIDDGITINGTRIWGSPVSPWFHDWAFGPHRGAEICKHWDLIPNDTDILVTHGPPANILDRTIQGESVGCIDLMAAVQRVRPKVHVFGHIHEGYGRIAYPDTDFYNASLMNARYDLVNDPFVVEV